MYGAIIGDLAGSIYEYSQIKSVQKVECKNLIEKNSFYSDDTILTIAILDAIINKKDYETCLKEYIRKYENYKPNFKPYFSSPFSPRLTKWANGKIKGDSNGNGAMMRISPIGYLYDTEEEVIKNTFLATIPSHNSIEAIKNATFVSLIIFYARKGLCKKEIIEKLNLNIRETKLDNFNITCSTTIDVCLFSLFTSNSFEESIRKVLSYGGDTDTNACIVGSMAEALYGLDKNLIRLAENYIPTNFRDLLEQGYRRIQKENNNDLQK